MKRLSKTLMQYGRIEEATKNFDCFQKCFWETLQIKIFYDGRSYLLVLKKSIAGLRS